MRTASCAWEQKWGIAHCIPKHLGGLLVLSAVSLETITALPLACTLSQIQVET